MAVINYYNAEKIKQTLDKIKDNAVLEVKNGGTGQGSLLENAFLLGHGNSAIQAIKPVNQSGFIYYTIENNNVSITAQPTLSLEQGGTNKSDWDNNDVNHLIIVKGTGTNKTLSPDIAISIGHNNAYCQENQTGNLDPASRGTYSATGSFKIVRNGRLDQVVDIIDKDGYSYRYNKHTGDTWNGKKILISAEAFWMTCARAYANEKLLGFFGSYNESASTSNTPRYYYDSALTVKSRLQELEREVFGKTAEAAHPLQSSSNQNSSTQSSSNQSSNTQSFNTLDFDDTLDFNNGELSLIEKLQVLEESVTSNTQAIEDLPNTIDGITQNLSNLNDNYESLESTIQDIKTQNFNLNEELISDISNRVAENALELIDIDEISSNIENTINNQIIDSIDSKVDSAITEVIEENINNQILSSSLNTRLSALEAIDFDNIISDISDLQESRQEINEALSGLDISAIEATIGNDIENLQTNLENMNATIEELSSNITSLDLDNINSKIQAIETNEVYNRLSAVEVFALGIENSVNDFYSQLHDVNTITIPTLNNTLNNKISILEDFKEDIEDLELDTFKSNIENLDLNTVLSNLNNKINLTATRLSEVNEVDDFHIDPMTGEITIDEPSGSIDDPINPPDQSLNGNFEIINSGNEPASTQNQNQNTNIPSDLDFSNNNFIAIDNSSNITIIRLPNSNLTAGQTFKIANLKSQNITIKPTDNQNTDFNLYSARLIIQNNTYSLASYEVITITYAKENTWLLY